MTRSRVSRRDIRLNLPRQGRVSDVLPYPCYFLCDECGWLEEAPAGGDPMRCDRSELSPGSCPSCQAQRWIDLRKQSLALAYRESEAFGDELHAKRSRRLGVLKASVMTVALLVGCLLAFEIERPMLWLGGLLAFWACQAWAYAGIVSDERPGRARPRRWRRPLPKRELVTAASTDAEGVVEGGAVLQTPLDREPCVAWAMQVWRGDELMLDERHHAELSVGGAQLPPDSVSLDLVLRPRSVPAANDDQFTRFMARRGLSPHDTSLRIVEAHLVSGVPVTLRRTKGRKYPEGLVLSQAPRALAS